MHSGGTAASAAFVRSAKCRCGCRRKHSRGRPCYVIRAKSVADGSPLVDRPRLWHGSSSGAPAGAAVLRHPRQICRGWIAAGRHAAIMAWLILLVAGVCEIVWAVCAKHSQGFTRLWPSVWTIVFNIISVVLLMLAMRRLPLGTA